MKRYLAFAGLNYYPSGGWADFVGEFDTVDEARSASDYQSMPKNKHVYCGDLFWHVVDTETKTIVDGNHPDWSEDFSERIG